MSYCVQIETLRAVKTRIPHAYTSQRLSNYLIWSDPRGWTHSHLFCQHLVSLRLRSHFGCITWMGSWRFYCPSVEANQATINEHRSPGDSALRRRDPTLSMVTGSVSVRA